MKVRVLALLSLAALLAAGPAAASSIGVFFAADGSDCDATQALFTPLDIYIMAVLGGDAAQGGITGAEFRMDGIPPGWFNSATANPVGTVALGNPIGGGCNLGFSSCQSGALVLLYTINSFATTSLSNLTYRVLPHSTPSNPFFPCPLLVICDAPDYTKVCVPGGTAFVNGGACTVGVAPTSWTGVKALYH